MSEDDDGCDLLGGFIEKFVMEQHKGFLTGFVFFATYVDEDGDTCYWGDTMAGQTCTQSLGLIGAMGAIEKRRIVDHHFGTNDG